MAKWNKSNYNKMECLRPNDIIYFCFDGRPVIYKAWPNGQFCLHEFDNEIIFHRINLGARVRRENFIDAAYGYPCRGGAWPECRENDFPALTRLVKAIFDRIKELETKQQEA